jgi:hypothetical protein
MGKGAVYVRPFRNTFGSPLWKTAAAIGLILFILIQIWPLAWRFFAEDAQVLPRNAAAEAALDIAREQFGIAAGPGQLSLVHLSDSDAVGYLSKEKLIDQYTKKWAKDYPTDVYRADLPLPEGGTLTLFLHMETGELAGFRDERTQAPPADRPDDPASGARAALDYAAAWGEEPGKWQWNGQDADPWGRYTFVLCDEPLGEARVLLKVRAPESFHSASESPLPWAGGSLEYEIRIPETFAAYMDKQEKWAGRMNVLGFILPQIVLIVLAVAYASHLRKHVSFRRGTLLAALFFILYCIFYFNMLPGLAAGLLADGAKADSSAVNAVMSVNLIILASLTLFTYFSAVAGDGLWRSMGFRLWPRWQDADFGQAVFDSMKHGYVLAFILLGVQSVILLVLELGIGMFISSDPSQSPYNMTVPGLLILLAWCAGISEELQSRLFGIGLFRSWLVGGAERLLGRPVSSRTENVLTWLAMVPPGAIWAFGHVGYAVYPAYSRLLELIVMALLLGWFMLRFGIIAVMFAHIILNSALMSVQLLFDGLPGDAGFAVAGLILPAAIAFLIRTAHQKRRPPCRQDFVPNKSEDK